MAEFSNTLSENKTITIYPLTFSGDMWLRMLDNLALHCIDVTVFPQEIIAVCTLLGLSSNPQFCEPAETFSGFPKES